MTHDPKITLFYRQDGSTHNNLGEAMVDAYLHEMKHCCLEDFHDYANRIRGIVQVLSETIEEIKKA